MRLLNMLLCQIDDKTQTSTDRATTCTDFRESFLFFYSLFADIFLRASSPVVDKTHSTALGSGDRAELSPDRAGLHRAEDWELTLTQVKFQQPLFLLPDVERCVSHIIRIICHLNAL